MPEETATTAPPTHWPEVKPLADAAELEALHSAAALDHHQVLYPTHVVRKAGEIVGYGSICVMPTLNVWLDSQRVKSRESLMLLMVAENLVRSKGLLSVVMPCAASSPFSPLMSSLGYTRLGETVLWVKQL